MRTATAGGEQPEPEGEAEEDEEDIPMVGEQDQPSGEDGGSSWWRRKEWLYFAIGLVVGIMMASAYNL
jgi:hypothetical protein